jgi:hypothetical protein
MVFFGQYETPWLDPQIILGSTKDLSEKINSRWRCYVGHPAVSARGSA